MSKRNIGNWEYPYKVWPEDFPYKGIFSKAFIAEQAVLNGFPRTEKFSALLEAALENIARHYYGEIYFKGKGSPSDKDILRDISNLSELAYVVKSRLENLPLELFEELSETTESRKPLEGDPYELEDVSHYRQCRINEWFGLPMPPIEDFYKNHNGALRFSALKSRLQADLNELSNICDSVSQESEWNFERRKMMGPQRSALDNLVYRLTLLWEYAAGKKATRYKNYGEVKSICLDFLGAVFAIISQHYQASIDPKHKPFSRTQLDTILEKYIKRKSGWREHKGDKECLKEALLEELVLHNIPA